MKIKIFLLTFLIFGAVFFCEQTVSASPAPNWTQPYHYCKCKDLTCKNINADPTSKTAQLDAIKECAACNGDMWDGSPPPDCLSFIPPPSTPAPALPSAKATPQGEVKLVNPLGIGTDVTKIIGTVINGLMGVMGAIVLLMVVWGAGAWLTSSGNPEKVKAGAQTMLWAVLGAVITVSSYVILSNILELITTNK